ncbi:Rap1a/Tai family immunity protein [Serratia ficaria]|uniref:Rap1a/Tai family immunity protein n=1 Tax=Serratia ficaria TaxID=61651 RepID=UPI002ED19C42|nr:Rap1a/Tai family immunity protein [Serratia ficaria]
MMNRKRFYLASLLAVACSIGTMPSAVAEHAPKQHLTSDDVNLPGADFFRLYRSADKQEKEKARIYLLGVLDATEGRSWCQYSQLQTVTLQEFIFEYFNKLPAERLHERASHLIEETLKTRFPCKGSQS